MKNLLLPLVLLSTPLCAQNFQIGINGGLIQNGVHNNWEAPYWVQDADRFQSRVITPDIGVRAMYVRKHYQFGLAVDYRQLTYKSLNYNPLSMTLIAGRVYRHTDREIPVKIFVNRTMHMKHMETYGGLAVGYVFINRHHEIIMPYENNNLGVQHTGAMAAGIQAGGTYYITKRIGINVEIAGEYINYASVTKIFAFAENGVSDVLDKGNFTLPASVGVRYKF